MTKRKILAHLKRIYNRIDCGDIETARIELRALIKAVQPNVIRTMTPDQAKIACELWGISDSTKG